MSADSDLIRLYSTRILALGADMPRTQRLANPDATVKRRAPLCGSTVTVDIRTEGPRIVDYGQDVKACALGQASAAILGAHVVGLTGAELRSARDQLQAMLTADGPTPAAPFEDLEILRPAKDYRNRHASILLAFDAALAALDAASQETRSA